MQIQICGKGSGGGQVVSVLAFYFVDPSSNPAEIYSFNPVNCLKRTKINKIEAVVGTFFTNMWKTVNKSVPLEKGCPRPGLEPTSLRMKQARWDDLIKLCEESGYFFLIFRLKRNRFSSTWSSSKNSFLWNKKRESGIFGTNQSQKMSLGLNKD